MKKKYGGAWASRHRSVGLHFERTGAVQLIDFLFCLGADVELHLDPAAALLSHQFLKLLGRINENVTRFKRAADANRFLLLAETL